MNFLCLIVLALKIVTILSSLDANLASQLICYSCRDSKAEKNNTCLNMPEDTTEYTMVCTRKFCYIKRVEVTGTGGIHLVERGCVESVAVGVEVAGGFTTYMRTCNNSLCNSWDGVADKYPASAAGDDAVSTGGVNGDDSVVILAPGLGGHSPASSVLSGYLWLLLLLPLLRSL